MTNFPLKYTNSNFKYTKRQGENTKEVPIPFHCSIDELEESKCLANKIWFCIPSVLINHLLPFRLKISDAFKQSVKGNIKIPTRYDNKYYITITFDRLGKDYWPKKDAYQKCLKVDPKEYRDVEFVKKESEKLIKYIADKILDKIHFTEL